MKKISKFIASFILICFLPNQLQAAPLSAAPEVRISQPTFLINVPPELGKAGNFHSGAGPAIVHIQSAHGNYEAEQKIHGILHYLKKQYGFNTIFVEGTSFPLDRKQIEFFGERRDLTLNAVDLLMKKALMKGSELFLLKDPEARIYGIENLDAYVRNGDKFRAVLTQTEKSRKFLKEFEELVERFAGTYFNKELKDFLRETARSGETGGFENFDYLAKSAVKNLELDFLKPRNQFDWPMLTRFARLQKIEKEFNSQGLEKERGEFLKQIKNSSLKKETASLLDLRQTSRSAEESEAVLEALSRALPQDFSFKKFPNVRLALAQAVLHPELDAPSFFMEIENLKSAIAAKLIRSPEEKQIYAAYRHYLLLKKLLALEITPAEYDKVLESKDALKPSQILQDFKMLGKQGRVKTLEFSCLDEIEDLFSGALDFYAGAKERDGLMLARVVERLKETKADKAVVITGGFHAKPFEDYFSRHHFNYALISPEIRSVQGREEYINAALQRSAYENSFPFSVNAVLYPEHRREIRGYEWYRAQLDKIKKQIGGIAPKRSELRTDADVTIADYEKAQSELWGFDPSGSRGIVYAPILALLKKYFPGGFQKTRGLELGVTEERWTLFKYLQKHGAEMRGAGYGAPEGKEFARENFLDYLKDSKNLDFIYAWRSLGTASASIGSPASSLVELTKTYAAMHASLNEGGFIVVIDDAFEDTPSDETIRSLGFEKMQSNIPGYFVFYDGGRIRVFRKKTTTALPGAAKDPRSELRAGDGGKILPYYQFLRVINPEARMLHSPISKETQPYRFPDLYVFLKKLKDEWGEIPMRIMVMGPGLKDGLSYQVTEIAAFFNFDSTEITVVGLDEEELAVSTAPRFHRLPAEWPQVEGLSSREEAELLEPLLIGANVDRMLDTSTKRAFEVDRSKIKAKIHPYRGEFAGLSYGENQLDVIVATYSLYYALTNSDIFEQIPLLARIIRALKPGGRLYLDLPTLVVLFDKNYDDGYSTSEINEFRKGLIRRLADRGVNVDIRIRGEIAEIVYRPRRSELRSGNRETSGKYDETLPPNPESEKLLKAAMKAQAVPETKEITLGQVTPGYDPISFIYALFRPATKTVLAMTPETQVKVYVPWLPPDQFAEEFTLTLRGDELSIQRQIKLDLNTFSLEEWNEQEEKKVQEKKGKKRIKIEYDRAMKALTVKNLSAENSVTVAIGAIPLSGTAFRSEMRTDKNSFTAKEVLLTDKNPVISLSLTSRMTPGASKTEDFRLEFMGHEVKGTPQAVAGYGKLFFDSKIFTVQKAARDSEFSPVGRDPLKVFKAGDSLFVEPVVPRTSKERRATFGIQILSIDEKGMRLKLASNIPVEMLEIPEKKKSPEDGPQAKIETVKPVPVRHSQVWTNDNLPRATQVTFPRNSSFFINFNPSPHDQIVRPDLVFTEAAPKAGGVAVDGAHMEFAFVKRDFEVKSFRRGNTFHLTPDHEFLLREGLRLFVGPQRERSSRDGLPLLLQVKSVDEKGIHFEVSSQVPLEMGTFDPGAEREAEVAQIATEIRMVRTAGTENFHEVGFAKPQNYFYADRQKTALKAVSNPKEIWYRHPDGKFRHEQPVRSELRTAVGASGQRRLRTAMEVLSGSLLDTRPDLGRPAPAGAASAEFERILTDEDLLEIEANLRKKRLEFLFTDAEDFRPNLVYTRAQIRPGDAFYPAYHIRAVIATGNGPRLISEALIPEFHRSFPDAWLQRVLEINFDPVDTVLNFEPLAEYQKLEEDIRRELSIFAQNLSRHMPRLEKSSWKAVLRAGFLHEIGEGSFYALTELDTDQAKRFLERWEQLQEGRMDFIKFKNLLKSLDAAENMEANQFADKFSLYVEPEGFYKSYGIKLAAEEATFFDEVFDYLRSQDKNLFKVARSELRGVKKDELPHMTEIAGVAEELSQYAAFQFPDREPSKEITRYLLGLKRLYPSVNPKKLAVPVLAGHMFHEWLRISTKSKDPEEQLNAAIESALALYLIPKTHPLSSQLKNVALTNFAYNRSASAQESIDLLARMMVLLEISGQPDDYDTEAAMGPVWVPAGGYQAANFFRAMAKNKKIQYWVSDISPVVALYYQHLAGALSAPNITGDIEDVTKAEHEENSLGQIWWSNVESYADIDPSYLRKLLKWLKKGGSLDLAFDVQKPGAFKKALPFFDVTVQGWIAAGIVDISFKTGQPHYDKIIITKLKKAKTSKAIAANLARWKEAVRELSKRSELRSEASLKELQEVTGVALDFLKRDAQTAQLRAEIPIPEGVSRAEYTGGYRNIFMDAADFLNSHLPRMKNEREIALRASRIFYMARQFFGDDTVAKIADTAWPVVRVALDAFLTYERQKTIADPAFALQILGNFGWQAWHETIVTSRNISGSGEWFKSSENDDPASLIRLILQNLEAIDRQSARSATFALSQIPGGLRSLRKRGLTNFESIIRAVQSLEDENTLHDFLFARGDDSLTLREVTLREMGPGAVAVLPYLLPLLRNPDEEVIRNVLRFIEQMGPAAILAAPELLDLRSAALRRRSMLTFGRLDYFNEEIINFLAGNYGADELALLQQMGPLHLEQLIRVSLSNRGFYRSHLSSIVQSYGEPAIDELIHLLDSKEEKIASAAAGLLGNFGPRAKRAIPALVRAAMEKKKSKVYLTALNSTGPLPADGSRDREIMKLVHEKGILSIPGFILNLFQDRDRQVLKLYLIELLRDADEAVAHSALKLFVHLKLVHEGKTYIGNAIIRAVEKGSDVSALLDSIKKPESKIARQEALQALQTLFKQSDEGDKDALLLAMLEIDPTVLILWPEAVQFAALDPDTYGVEDYELALTHMRPLTAKHRKNLERVRTALTRAIPTEDGRKSLGLINAALNALSARSEMRPSDFQALDMRKVFQEMDGIEFEAKDKTKYRLKVTLKPFMRTELPGELAGRWFHQHEEVTVNYIEVETGYQVGASEFLYSMDREQSPFVLGSRGTGIGIGMTDAQGRPFEPPIEVARQYRNKGLKSALNKILRQKIPAGVWYFGTIENDLTLLQINRLILNKKGGNLLAYLREGLEEFERKGAKILEEGKDVGRGSLLKGEDALQFKALLSFAYKDEVNRLSAEELAQTLVGRLAKRLGDNQWIEVYDGGRKGFYVRHFIEMGGPLEESRSELRTGELVTKAVELYGQMMATLKKIGAQSAADSLAVRCLLEVTQDPMEMARGLEAAMNFIDAMKAIEADAYYPLIHYRNYQRSHPARSVEEFETHMRLLRLSVKKAPASDNWADFKIQLLQPFVYPELKKAGPQEKRGIPKVYWRSRDAEAKKAAIRKAVQVLQKLNDRKFIPFSLVADAFGVDPWQIKTFLKRQKEEDLLKWFSYDQISTQDEFAKLMRAVTGDMREKMGKDIVLYRHEVEDYLGQHRASLYTRVTRLYSGQDANEVLAREFGIFPAYDHHESSAVQGFRTHWAGRYLASSGIPDTAFNLELAKRIKSPGEAAKTERPSRLEVVKFLAEEGKGAALEDVADHFGIPKSAYKSFRVELEAQGLVLPSRVLNQEETEKAETLMTDTESLAFQGAAAFLNTARDLLDYIETVSDKAGAWTLIEKFNGRFTDAVDGYKRNGNKISEDDHGRINDFKKRFAFLISGKERKGTAHVIADKDRVAIKRSLRKIEKIAKKEIEGDWAAEVESLVKYMESIANPGRNRFVEPVKKGIEQALTDYPLNHGGAAVDGVTLAGLRKRLSKLITGKEPKHVRQPAYKDEKPRSELRVSKLALLVRFGLLPVAAALGYAAHYEKLKQQKVLPAVREIEAEKKRMPVFYPLLVSQNKIKRQVLDYREVPENAEDLAALAAYALYHPEVRYTVLSLASKEDAGRIYAGLKKLSIEKFGVMPANLKIEAVGSKAALARLAQMAAASKIPTGFISADETVFENVQYQAGLLRVVGYSKNPLKQTAAGILTAEKIRENLEQAFLREIHAAETLDAQNRLEALAAEFKGLMTMLAAA